MHGNNLYDPGLHLFLGKKVRLHIQADNATSLFAYRFGVAS